MVHAYYKVALKRFKENVWKQVGDKLFVSGPFIPLRLFSSEWVKQRTEQQLEDMVGEDKKTLQKRKGLNGRIKDLESAIKVITSP